MSLWSYWDELCGHKRRYDKNELIKKIGRTGFKVIKISYFRSFLLPVAFPFRILKIIFGKRTSDFIEIPKVMHKILLALSLAENKMLNLVNIPFGLSLLAVAKR